jgi:hypothetical protein
MPWCSRRRHRHLRPEERPRRSRTARRCGVLRVPEGRSHLSGTAEGPSLHGRTGMRLPAYSLVLGRTPCAPSPSHREAATLDMITATVACVHVPYDYPSATRSPGGVNGHLDVRHDWVRPESWRGSAGMAVDSGVAGFAQGRLGPLPAPLHGLSIAQAEGHAAGELSVGDLVGGGLFHGGGEAG